MTKFNLENALHEKSPVELGLFPLRVGLPFREGFDAFIKDLKFLTKSPRFVVGTKSGQCTIMCDVSYDNCIVVNYYDYDCFHAYETILKRGMGGINPTSTVYFKYNPRAYAIFEEALYVWVRDGASPDAKMEFHI